MEGSSSGQRFSKMSAETKRRKRRQLIKRDGNCCHYCQKSLLEQQMTIDHKHPSSLGGSNALENLVIACLDCNGKKGHQPYDIFLEERRKSKRKKFPH